MPSIRAVLVVLVVCCAALGGYAAVYGPPAWLAAWMPGGGEQGREEERPPTRVVLGEASEADVTITAEAVGDVIARDAVTLSARVTGRLIEILFTDGQRVEKGQILARIDPGEANADVKAAEARAEELRQSVERASELATKGAGPRAVADDRQQQLEAAESNVQSAREVLDDYNVRAPFAGRLGLRDISVGALVQPGTPIATLDTIDPIEVRFALPERYLGQIRPDAPVEVNTPAFPDEGFKGKVLAVGTRVDPALRTVDVEASIPNPDGRILPGMLMNVMVSLGLREDAVVVPSLAVRLQGATHFVFTIEQGKAKRLDVEIGQRDPERVEVVKGLKSGDKVVVEGPQDLNSGQSVQEAKEGEGEERPTEAATSAG